MKQGLFLFLSIILFFCSCVRKRDLSENTAIVHLAGKPNGLHITNDISGFRAFVFEYTHRPAVRIDLRTMQLTPVLVKEIPELNEDRVSYTYHLRNDIRWDDGSLITVEDILFSAKMVLSPLTNNPQIKGNFMGVIKSIEKNPADSSSFILITHSPNRANEEILSEVYLLQKKVWDPENITDELSFEDCYDPNFKPGDKLRKWSEDFNAPEKSTRPEFLVGNGPYRLTEWVGDSHIVLEKKESWWGESDTSFLLQNYPDKIVFKIIKDESSTYYALRNENIDAINRIGLTRLLKLQKHDYFNERYESGFVDQYAYNYIGLNTRPDGIVHKPFFTDKRVRRAIAHLIPVDDIIKVLYKGKAERQVSFVSPFKKDYNKDLQPVPYDIARARELLNEAGWKDSDGDNILDKKVNGEKLKFSFRLNYMSDAAPSREMALMVKDELYRAGIEVIPVPLDFSLFYEKAYSHDFDAMMGAWMGSALYEDPSQLWSTEQWSSFGNNFCGFGDASSDSLIHSVNTEMDDSLYLVKIHALQKRVYEDQPYIFLYTPKARVAIHKRFKGGFYVEKPSMSVNNFILNPSYSGSAVVPDITQ